MSFAVCVTSASGASGTSTLCAALASAVAQGGNTCAVLDCNGGCGELDFLLGVSETCVFNAGDILRGRCEAEDAVFEPYDGIKLLPAANDGNDAPLGRLRPLGALFEKGENKSDVILLDMPHGMSADSDELYKCADMVLLCCKAKRRDVRRAAVVRRRLLRLGVETRLVITDFSEKQLKSEGINDLDSVIDTVKARLIGVIPHDEGFSDAFDTGTVPEGGAAVEAVKRIAKRLTGESVYLPNEYV